MRELKITIVADGSQATSELGKVDRALDKTTGEAQQLEKTFTITGAGIGKAVAGVAVGLAALDVAGLTKKAVDNTSKIRDAMERMGITSAAAVQKLKFAAEQGGASLQTVDAAIKEMAKSLTGDKAAERLIEELGLDLQKLKAGKPEETFLEFTDAIRKIENPLERAKASLVVFGRSGTELLPAVNAGFREVGEQAPLMSDAVVEMGDKVGDQLDKVRGKFEALQARALLPFANFFLNYLPDSVQVGIVGISQFLPSIETLTLGIIAAGGPMAVLGGLATFFTVTLPAAFTAILPFLGPVGLLVAGITAVFLAWKYWDEIVAFFKGAWQFVVEQLQAAPDWLLALTGPIGAPVLAFRYWEEIVAFFQGAWQFVVNTVKATPSWILPALGPIGLIVAAFRHWEDIVGIVRRVYEGVKTWLLDKFTGIVDGVKTQIDKVTGFFKGMADAVVLNSYVPDMVTQIGQWFAKLPALMVGPAEGAAGQVEGVFARMANNIGASIGSALFSGSGNVTQRIGSALGSGLGGMIGGQLGKLIPIPGVGGLLGSLAGAGIEKLTNWIGGMFGQSAVNKDRDKTIKDYAGINDLDRASDKIRELGFAAGVSDAEMRSLFSADRVEDFQRIFLSVTDQIAQFNQRAARSIDLMKEELATPVVIPVTFGMINPGLGGGGWNNTDMFSPKNFGSYDEWVQNWLGRNPNDEHRIGEALGDHVFHAGGTVPGRGERRATLLGGEGVLSHRGMNALDALNRGQGPGTDTTALEAEVRGLRADLALDRQTRQTELRAALAIARGSGMARA